MEDFKMGAPVLVICSFVLFSVACYEASSLMKPGHMTLPSAGLPSLLGNNGACDPPLYLNPVADQQRMSNMNAVLGKLAAVGAVPHEGQVGERGLHQKGQARRSQRTHRPPLDPLPLPLNLQRLLTRGGLAPMRARDIVDANRESTLGMLMHMAQRWQAPRLVSLTELKAEVKRLLKVR